MRSHPAAIAAKKIASLQIQGATAISLAALDALADSIHLSKTKSISDLLKECESSTRILSGARPTEPLLMNILLLSLCGHEEHRSLQAVKTSILSKLALVRETLRQDHHHIAELIRRKVPENGVVFTHCHSSTVVRGLIEAWKSGIRFTVHNTETRPLFQGRKTATELARHKIPVIHWVDLAAMDALRHCDLALFGCDAILSGGVANKIGTRMFCHCAKQIGVPAYFCAHSLKLDIRSIHGRDIIEERSPSEIWIKPPIHVRIMNPAFDITEPEFFEGIISEQGILPHATLVSLTRERNPWMSELR